MTMNEVRNQSILESHEIINSAVREIGSLITEAKKNGGQLTPKQVSQVEDCLIIVDGESQITRAALTDSLKELSETYKPLSVVNGIDNVSELERLETRLESLTVARSKVTSND